MLTQTEKAAKKLVAARAQISKAMAILVGITEVHVAGMNCACGGGRSCAYHSELINRAFEANRRIEGILEDLNADIADPMRSR